jgi:hypothetical protein
MGIGQLIYLLESKTSTLRSFFLEGICLVLKNLSHAVVLFLLTSVPESLVAVSYIFFLVLISNQNVRFPDFPHLGNGSQAALVHHACSAYRVILVPENSMIRMACIVPDHEEPHSHPILPPTKTPVAIKEVYRNCIKNAGIVGSSVRTIDNGEV